MCTSHVSPSVPVRPLPFLTRESSLPLYAQFVGLFIDFACLPQKDANGERSAEDTAIFKRGMQAMNSLYSSSNCSTVLQIKTLPTAPADDTSTYSSRPCDSSGWCLFEESAAQLVTGTEALIAHQLNFLRDPILLFAAHVLPVLKVFLSAVCGESIGANLSLDESEKAAKALIQGVNMMTRPKLLDLSDASRPREVKLCAAP